MRSGRRFARMPIGVGLTLFLIVGLLAFGRATAPGNPILDPPRNNHTAPLTATISITYDEPISATTVTSRTFAVHAMQSGLVTATHAVSGGTISVTPTRPLHQGELVYVVATTGTLGLDGTPPLSATQWQFRAGQVADRCVGGFVGINAGLPGPDVGSVAWGDYDGDGDLDILLTGELLSGRVSRVYRNDDGIFPNIGAGLRGVCLSSVMWGDYDNDGDLDILLSGLASSGVSLVYRNDHGSFVDIHAGLLGVHHSSAAWGDYDNDGDLDILLTGFTGSTRTSRVYRNDDSVFANALAGLVAVDRGAAAWGDYDSDGDLDILLTGATEDSRVSRVYRNDGGHFTDTGAGLIGVEDSSVAWGDYDDDGDLDVLLAGSTGNKRVSRVYRNDDGYFTDIDAGLPGAENGSVEWGDYDNDGDLDILLTGSFMTRIFRNDEGSFTHAGAGLPDLEASSATWGDYDNDGDLDILLIGATWTLPADIIEIYRNEDCSAFWMPDLALHKDVTPQAGPGDPLTYTLTFRNQGLLTATHVIITDAIPLSVTVSSVLSSGVAITDTGSSPPYVWEVQNLAPGQAGAIAIVGHVSPTLSRGTVLVNTAIISSTSPDALLANNTGHARLTVGPFATPILVNPPRNSHTAPPTTTIWATYDQPISRTTVTSRTFFVHGMQSGLVTPTRTVLGGTVMVVPTSPFYKGEMVHVTATTATLSVAGTEPFFPTVWHFRASVPGGSGQFISNPQWQIDPMTHTVDVALGDLDGDGDLDAFAVNMEGPDTIWLNDGEGNYYNSGQTLGSLRTGGVALGDLDADGDLDAFVANDWLVKPNFVWLNDGTGVFTDSGQRLGDSNSYDVELGDVDGDGDLDAFVANSGPEPASCGNRVWLNDGRGVFTGSGQLLGDQQSLDVALGDLDNDGDLDAFVANGWIELPNTVWFNTGAGGFVDSGQRLGDGDSRGVALGDVDSDGDLDAVVANWGIHSIDKVWLNDGMGSFFDSGQTLGILQSQGVALGDLDGDGDLDAIITAYFQPTRMWLNDGKGTFSDSGQDLGDSDSWGVVLGDADTDRDLDAIVAAKRDRRDMVWLNRNRADLSITKTVDRPFAKPGSTITFTLSFRNVGPQVAKEVVIVDAVPLSITVTSVISSGVTITNTGVSPPYAWDVQDLDAGEGGVITISGYIAQNLNGGHALVNTATIASTALDTETDNNASRAVVSVYDSFIYLPLVFTR